MNTLRNDILIILSDQTQTIDEAAEKILALFNVVGRSEQLNAFLLFIQESAPNYRTKQLKPDQVIKAYIESL